MTEPMPWRSRPTARSWRPDMPITALTLMISRWHAISWTAAGSSGPDFALARYDGDTPACPIQFTDVAPDSTFYAYVRCLACRNIVGGYSTTPPCTTGVPCFLPANNVTRGQTAKFVANAAG